MLFAIYQTTLCICALVHAVFKCYIKWYNRLLCNMYYNIYHSFNLKITTYLPSPSDCCADTCKTHHQSSPSEAACAASGFSLPAAQSDTATPVSWLCFSCRCLSWLPNL